MMRSELSSHVRSFSVESNRRNLISATHLRQMTENITSRFRQDLSLALLPISPQLSALHASRHRLLAQKDPSIPVDASTSSTTTCTKCGGFLFPGHGQVRVQTKRVKENKGKRGGGEDTGSTTVQTLVKSCGLCGYTDHIHMNGTRAARQKFKSVRGAKRGIHVTRLPVALVPSVIDIPPTMPPPPAISFPTAIVAASPISARGSASSSTLSPASIPAPTSMKPRGNKKRSGLQELLARNKAAQKSDQSTKTSSGLQQFLTGL